MEEADLFTLMVTSTKEIGSMTKQRVTEYIPTWMALSTKGNGEKISSMVKGLKHGLMEQGTMAITRTERSMVEDISSGQIVHLTMASFTKTIFMDMEVTDGLMEESTEETGA